MPENGDFRIHRDEPKRSTQGVQAHARATPSGPVLVLLATIFCATLVALCGIAAWWTK